MEEFGSEDLKHRDAIILTRKALLKDQFYNMIINAVTSEYLP